MEQPALIVDTAKHVGSEIEVVGRIASRRDMGKIVFLDVEDRSAALQVVLGPDAPVEDRHAPHAAAPSREATVKDLREGCTIRVAGLVKERGARYMNPKLATGTVELEGKRVALLSVSQPFPFDPKEEIHIDTYLDHLPFTLRTPRARAVFRVQTAVVEGFRRALRARGFTEFQAPAIVGGSTEGGANVFTLDYFGKPAFLAQSPQFYKQIMVGVFERVFTVAKAFRAELHATTRHLNEYTTLDLEFGPITDHRDVMRLQNDMLIDLVAFVREECGHYFSASSSNPPPLPGGELEGVSNEPVLSSPASRGGARGGASAPVSDPSPLFAATLPTVPQEIPSLKLREAQEVLKREFGLDCVGEPDLDPEHERKLCEWSAKEHGSDFLFITHYPTSKRPLYTMPDPEDPEFTLSFDLLFRGVEITTGGQRIHDYAMLKASMEKRGLNPANFAYYLEAFQYGMPPEGGLAIGLERLTQKLLGLDNVKLATLFPRDISRIDERLSGS